MLPHGVCAANKSNVKIAPIIKINENERLSKSIRHIEKNIYIEAAAKDLSTRFGRKVAIISGKKKGKVEFEFYDQTDLMLLLDALETVRMDRKGGSGS